MALASAATLIFTGVAWSQQHRSDPFGIERIYADARDGQQWAADWDTKDWSDDPWVQLGSRDIHYDSADGVLTVSGETSRLYVRDPQEERQWGNVEVTVYAKRIDDAGVPYSGIVTAVRTNHGTTAPIDQAPCDSRAIAARMRFDGSIDFGKETSHPTWAATDKGVLFPGGLPRNKWIGYKHVVYDIPGGTRQEMWLDRTGGRDGGTWELVATHDDTGGIGTVACAPGIDPTLPLRLGERAGSESGLPNISVLLRADGIARDGLQYKWFSVREIIPPRR